MKDLGIWYQLIDFEEKGNKITGGKGDVVTTWNNIKTLLPENLNGYRVLDLGCNAGIYCINSILMGAREAIGIDNSDVYYKQALFLREHMEKKHDRIMNIKYINGPIHKNLKELGKFDIVFALSILYHIKNNHIQEVCKWIADNTNNIICRFRNNNDIKRFTLIFAQHGFEVKKQFKENNIFTKDTKRKKYLIQYIK
jgi:ribosomal protein L11 methylase PrmA